MKFTLALLITLVSSIASAQQAGVQTPGAPSSVTPEVYRAEVAKMVAGYPNGDRLYRKSDLFSRMVERAVGLMLGLFREGSDAVETSSSQEAPLGTTTHELDISHTTVKEDEPSIAISRSNQNIIVAGANDDAMSYKSMPVYLSTNAGSSWTSYRLPIPNVNGCQATGDPIIVDDGAGGFYYAFMIDSPLINAGQPFVSDMMVAHSTDGKRWTLGGPVLGNTTPDVSLEDKETIAVDDDPASPHHGRLYIAWRHFNDFTNGGGGDYQMFSYSDDHGMTWAPAQTPWSNYPAIALLRVGKGGTVFLAGSGNDTVTSGTGHGMHVSHDGGATFIEHSIADYIDYPYSQILTRNALKGDSGFRAFPYIAFDVDPASNKLYAAYGNFEDGGYASENLVTSTDEGRTWSQPQQVGTPSLIATDHFFPWVSFDPVAKRALVTLYSSEDDPIKNVKSRAVLADFALPGTVVPLGSAAFDPKVLLNSSSDPLSGAFLGDYIASDAYAGTFAATWTENRPKASDGDIFAYVSSPNGAGVTSAINAREFSVSDAYPNPSSGNSITMRLRANVESLAMIRLFDLTGREVLTRQLELSPGEESAIDLDLHALPAGVYRALISSGSKSIEEDVIVLR